MEDEPVMKGEPSAREGRGTALPCGGPCHRHPGEAVSVSPAPMMVVEPWPLSTCSRA